MGTCHEKVQKIRVKLNVDITTGRPRIDEGRLPQGELTVLYLIQQHHLLTLLETHMAIAGPSRPPTFDNIR